MVNNKISFRANRPYWARSWKYYYSTDAYILHILYIIYSPEWRLRMRLCFQFVFCKIFTSIVRTHFPKVGLVFSHQKSTQNIFHYFAVKFYYAVKINSKTGFWLSSFMTLLNRIVYEVNVNYSTQSTPSLKQNATRSSFWFGANKQGLMDFNKKKHNNWPAEVYRFEWFEYMLQRTDTCVYSYGFISII